MRQQHRDRGAVMLAAAIGIAAFGVVTATISAVFAGTADGIPALPAVLTGTGATAAVSLAIYISKKLLSGEITPLPITTLIDKMDKIIERQDQRDDRAKADHAELRELVKQATQAQFAIHEYLRGAAPRPTPPPARVDTP